MPTLQYIRMKCIMKLNFRETFHITPHPRNINIDNMLAHCIGTVGAILNGH